MSKPLPVTSSDEFKAFKEFLADKCYDLKKYKEGKYDKKIFDYFSSLLQQERAKGYEEALEEIEKEWNKRVNEIIEAIGDEPWEPNWRGLFDILMIDLKKPSLRKDRNI